MVGVVIFATLTVLALAFLIFTYTPRGKKTFDLN
jgi:hypothetical protein